MTKDSEDTSIPARSPRLLVNPGWTEPNPNHIYEDNPSVVRYRKRKREGGGDTG